MLEKVVEKLNNKYIAIGILTAGVIGDTITTHVGVSKYGVSSESNETLRNLIQTYGNTLETILLPKIAFFGILIGGLYFADKFLLKNKGILKDPIIYYFVGLPFFAATINNAFHLLTK